MRRADNLIMKSGSLNLQETSGRAQSCTEIVLHFLFNSSSTYTKICVKNSRSLKLANNNVTKPEANQ